MAVKLELYRVFQEVAKMGNISAAAQNLYISQSAVSQSIKQLEEQLQVRLFSRSTRGVMLTSEGRTLLEYVTRALGLIQNGEEKLAQSRQLLTGELIIGASDTVTKTYLVSRLEAFHKAYPDIRIRILNGTSRMVLDYLRGGQVDIAFASEEQDAEVYCVRHCVDTHTIFVAAPDYDCDFDHPYTVQEIAEFPLILLERKASSRLYVERYFQEHGVTIQPEIELGSHNLLVALARIGLGVACVTEEFSLSGLGRGVILPLKTDFTIPPRACHADARRQPLHGFRDGQQQNGLRSGPFLPFHERIGERFGHRKKNSMRETTARTGTPVRAVERLLHGFQIIKDRPDVVVCLQYGRQVSARDVGGLRPVHQPDKILLHFSGEEILIGQDQENLACQHRKICCRDRLLMHQVGKQAGNMYVLFLLVVLEDRLKHILRVGDLLGAFVADVAHTGLDERRLELFICGQVHHQSSRRLRCQPGVSG